MDIEYVLAADGGGTKTRVWCATLSGEVVGEGFSGPTSLTVVSVGEASLNLAEGVRQATQNLPEKSVIKKLVVGLAGADTLSEIESARRVFEQSLAHFLIQKIEIVNDVVIALYSGTTAKNGIALISGNGSNCYGRNEQNLVARAGGLDFVLSDEGSGYAIGCAVLHAAVQSADGRAPKTLLESLILNHFQVGSMIELKNVIYHPLISKAEIASLSKVCATAFLQHDATAESIFRSAADALLRMVQTVAAKLDFADSQFACVLVGGVFEIEFLRTIVTQKLQALYPKISIVLPTKPPVAGALHLALRGGS